MALVVFDGLDMLVTSEPVAELDGALAQAATELRAARSAGDRHTVSRLRAWIDYRLDERCQFAYGPRPDTTPACGTASSAGPLKPEA